jgi:hypothetical protein
MSVPPPGDRGTIAFRVRSGYSARASLVPAAIAAAPAPTNKVRLLIVIAHPRAKTAGTG